MLPERRRAGDLQSGFRILELGLKSGPGLVCGSRPVCDDSFDGDARCTFPGWIRKKASTEPDSPTSRSKPGIQRQFWVSTTWEPMVPWSVATVAYNFESQE